MTVLSILGWFGTVLYLANHSYLSLVTRWRPLVYYGGNFVAATLLVFSSVAIESWQAVCINGFWSVVSLLLLCRVDLSRLPFHRSWFYLAMAIMLGVTAATFFLDTTLTIAMFGWSSTLAFCASYLLFSASRISVRTYLFWNSYAALALLPQLWLDQNWPVFGLECAWAIISIYGLFQRRQEVHLID